MVTAQYFGEKTVNTLKLYAVSVTAKNTERDNMNQYYIVFKDGGFEYVYAYGYKTVGGRYEFDTGHGSVYYITKEIVESIEVLE